MKNIVLVLLAAFLVSCGAPIQKSTTGLEETTQIVLLAENLVGLDVTVGNIDKKIGRSDLERYRLGVAGAADAEIENMHRVTIAIQPGNHRVIIKDGGQTLIDRSMYFSAGQTREIKVR